jgi:hypothetical protein
MPEMQVFKFENKTLLALGYNSHLKFQDSGISPDPRPPNVFLKVRIACFSSLFHQIMVIGQSEILMLLIVMLISFANVLLLFTFFHST